jgi:hypothetical protein
MRADPFVTLQYLDELMDGYHYDAVVDTDSKAEEFMESQYDSWIDAVSTARDFLADFHELLDGNSQADPARFKNLPRQIPGVDAPRYGTLEDANNGDIPPIQPLHALLGDEPASKRVKLDEVAPNRGKLNSTARGGSRGGHRGRGGRGRRGARRGSARAGNVEPRPEIERRYPNDSGDDDDVDEEESEGASIAQLELEASVAAHSSTLQRRKAGRFVKKAEASGSDESMELEHGNAKPPDPTGDKIDSQKLPRSLSSAEVNSSQESVVPISQQPWTGLSLGATNSSQSDGELSNGSGGTKRKRKSITASDPPEDLTNLIGMTTKRTKILAAQAAERAALQAYASRGYFHPRRESKRAAAQAAAAVVASAVAAQADEDRYFDLMSTKPGTRSKKPSRGSNKGGRPKAPRRNLPKLVFSSDEGDSFSDEDFPPNFLAADLVEAVKAEEAPLSSPKIGGQGEDLMFAALLGLASMADSKPDQ